MRYTYAATTALLAAGSALALATGHPAGAQAAQNEGAAAAQMVPRPGAPASFADLTEQLQPAVVNISTRQRVRVQTGNPFAGTPFADLFGGQGQGGRNGGEGGQNGNGEDAPTREAQSLGSGFLISADGYVVTNNHVISAEGNGSSIESITVNMPDGTEYPARLVGRDSASDLAVLKIDGRNDFPFVRFGDSRNARVGDWIIAIGNPFGLGGTVTSGIISAVYRNTGTGSAYDRYLQTDASINRGNSGGPMFDMAGNVIGINNAIFSPTGGNVGIGFAIPAEIAAPIVDKLRNGQSIDRGYLGVRIQPLNEDLAASLGIARNRGEFIQAVEPNQGGARAGIQAGDVVMKVDGKEVTPDQTLSFIVANTAPGSRIPIELIRDGRRMSVTAVVGKRPTEEELAQQSFDAEQEEDFTQSRPGDAVPQGLQESVGLAVAALTPQIARQLGVSDDVRGVVISQVNPSSDAAAKGLRRGDIILSINNRATPDVATVSNMLAEAKRSGREAVLLRVQRRGVAATYVPVRVK